MKFQITIRTAPTVEDTLAHLSVFIVDAPNWDMAASRVVALGVALGLEFGQYESEIIYASKEDNTIRAGSLHRFEAVHTFPSER